MFYRNKFWKLCQNIQTVPQIRMEAIREFQKVTVLPELPDTGKEDADSDGAEPGTAEPVKTPSALSPG